MSKAAVLEHEIVIESLETRTRARLVTLKENRSRFLEEAQRNLAALDAAIAELSALMEPPSVVEQNGRVEESDEGAT